MTGMNDQLKNATRLAYQAGWGAAMRKMQSIATAELASLLREGRDWMRDYPPPTFPPIQDEYCGIPIVAAERVAPNTIEFRDKGNGQLLGVAKVK